MRGVIFLLRNVFMMILLNHAAAESLNPFNIPSKLVILVLSKHNVTTSLRSGHFDVDKIYDVPETAATVHEQHKRKMKELNEYMKSHILSTNYFYSEMKRIIRTRQIKGIIRSMVDWLEDPQHKKERQQVINCYKTVRKEEASHNSSVWNHPTNNLVINYIRDPFNDGLAK